ncbi:hypothetical protein Y032_0022g612 [Ancylostoma ceylanicum]|nr:hypothetical protein Y032_0022g612 [Ancylostoma ceylanicum]
MVAMLIHCTPRTDVPSGSSDSVLSGYERVRLRAHRRRHRHKTSLNLEADELFEMFGDHLHRNQHRTRKNKNAVSTKRERNEELCLMERRTIDLNTMGDEFDPPFLVEVRCQNTADYERGNTDTLVEQTCVHNLLRCVQRYGENHGNVKTFLETFMISTTVRYVLVACPSLNRCYSCCQRLGIPAAAEKSARFEAACRICSLEPSHFAERADRLRLHVARGPVRAPGVVALRRLFPPLLRF